MTEPVFLTIGVPTYLREDSLKGLLAQLAGVRPTVSCELLIINNGPEFSTPLDLAALSNAGYQVRLMRNQRNCGGQENVIRIYENAAGQYTWFLGDDDRLYPGAVEAVMDALRDHPCDCLFFDATAPDHPRIDLQEGMHGLEEFLGGRIPLRKLMFAPLYVLRTAAIESALARARLNMGCFTPQLLLTLGGTVKDFYYLKRDVITCEEVEVGRDQRLSLLPVFLGLGRLPSVEFPRPVGRQLRRLMNAEWFQFLRPTRVLAALAIAKMQGRAWSFTRYSAAGFRNYPWWLSPFFPVALLGIAVTPRAVSASVLDFLANKVMKKGVDFNRYFSGDRI